MDPIVNVVGRNSHYFCRNINYNSRHCSLKFLIHMLVGLIKILIEKKGEEENKELKLTNQFSGLYSNKSTLYGC